MVSEVLSAIQEEEPTSSRPEVNRYERHRLIAHLGRTFARRYDLQVIPSGQKGLWACGLDPKIQDELVKYIEGKRGTLDDLPAESFRPRQILYDAQSAQKMSLEEITTLLHHEAGHARYTDYRLMIEGQRQAHDQGYLPTSFWLTFEGIEDPRVNSLEGEESPAIDRQIRVNQGKDLEKRTTEMPLADRPRMLQFAYDSFHRWLYDKGIPELAQTEVGQAAERAAPLLAQYFQNTDVEERKVLQKQIWDIAKGLEKKDVEDEEKRQVHEQQQSQQGGQQQGQGQQGEGQSSGSGEGQQGGQGDGRQSAGQSGGGEGQAGMPSIPGGKGYREQTGNSGPSRDSQQKNLLEKLKGLFGRKSSPPNASQTPQGEGQEGNEQGGAQPRPNRLDLSKLMPEEMRQIQEAIDQMSPQQRAELAKKAREAIDQLQKEALEEDFNKTFRLVKNKKTGEYEVRPVLAGEKEQRGAQENYQQILQEVEAQEQADWQKEEAQRRQQEELLRQLEAERREKLEMEKAGFAQDERDKFLLYQALEDVMYSHVHRFRMAIGRIIPRRREVTYEGGYFTGPKFDKRELIRRAPVGDIRFHMRQVEKPTGEPRLFVGLLIDNSGSMEGVKMEQARKTTIFFAKVCREMGIPFMAAAFGDKAEVIKQFKQDFDNPAERIKPKIIDATDASGGWTDMHAGIKITIEAMNEQRRRLRDSHGLIFVITDGLANTGLTGSALRGYIEQNRGRLTFKGFGLSGNSLEREQIQTGLNNYFGASNCAYPQGFEDLPDEAFRVLRVNLMQFARLLS